MIDYKVPAGLVQVPFKDGSGFWYTHHGKWIRSVSKILERIYPMPPDLDPWYLERGKAVHHATTLMDAGTLDWESLDPRLVPFLEAYGEFVHTARPVVEASELVVVHPSFSFGARLDRVFRLPGQDRLVVLDIKTGIGRFYSYWLQVAGCAMALDEGNIRDYDLAILNIDGKGKPHFTVADDPANLINRWREILEVDKI